MSFKDSFLHSDSHLSEGPYIPLHRLFPSQNSPPTFLLKMKTMAGWDGGARFELGKALYIGWAHVMRTWELTAPNIDLKFNK